MKSIDKSELVKVGDIKYFRKGKDNGFNLVSHDENGEVIGLINADEEGYYRITDLEQKRKCYICKGRRIIYEYYKHMSLTEAEFVMAERFGYTLICEGEANWAIMFNRGTHTICAISVEHDCHIRLIVPGINVLLINNYKYKTTGGFGLAVFDIWDVKDSTDTPLRDVHNVIKSHQQHRKFSSLADIVAMLDIIGDTEEIIKKLSISICDSNFLNAIRDTTLGWEIEKERN